MPMYYNRIRWISLQSMLANMNLHKIQLSHSSLAAKSSGQSRFVVGCCHGLSTQKNNTLSLLQQPFVFDIVYNTCEFSSISNHCFPSLDREDCFLGCLVLNGELKMDI